MSRYQPTLKIAVPYYASVAGASGGKVTNLVWKSLDVLMVWDLCRKKFFSEGTRT
jgi:hypothetical protein